MKNILFALITLIPINSFLFAQIYSEEDVEICNQKFQISIKEDLKDQPINDVVVVVGKSFIGTEYLAKGLEEDGDEQLVVNLSGLDCTTFVEYCVALARCVKKGASSFDDYMEEVQIHSLQRWRY